MTDSAETIDPSSSATFRLANLLVQLVEMRYSGRRELWRDLSLSEKELEQMRQSAAELYSRERYGEAADAYVLLVTLHPLNKEYWRQLALAEKANGDPRAALVAYGMMATADCDDPAPHLYAAECYLELEQFTCASRSLGVAILCGLRPDLEGDPLSTLYHELRKSIREAATVQTS